jgi:hypothetical protein
VHFLHVRPGQDASRAARRMRAPSEAARELMANGGVVPGSLAAAQLATSTTSTTQTATTQATEAVAPAATPVVPAVTPVPTPAAVTPVEPEPTTTDPSTGGTVAAATSPQG